MGAPILPLQPYLPQPIHPRFSLHSSRGTHPIMSDYKNLPDFDSLPTIDGVPHRAWGLFDKDGKKDHLGCINLLTPDVVKEAYKEARDGVSISLNWPTLNHWHERGGLVGRAVLLDYKEYARAKGIKYSCFDRHPITVQDLENVAKHQGTTFKHGDILIVRSGFTDELTNVSAEEQAQLLGSHECIGVQGNKEMARWTWNHHFAAVAGDAIGYEVIPPTIEEDNNRVGTIAELVLHQYFLSNFGLNIGELWDLKALGEHCKKVGRYEFLLTSCPLNVPGSVGSPPNALAIF